jgi:hypothetical protein
MAQKSLHIDLNLVPRGYIINPDWNRNFRENQDKRTKLIGDIIDIELGQYLREDTMLSDVYFTKYWGWNDNYCLVYRIKEKYNNVGILIGAILESTDEILKWYDLTINFNFNVYIITPYETFRFTYLDLLYEYITMRPGNGRNKAVDVLMKSHPRAELMKEWVSKYRNYVRVTEKASGGFGPFSYSDTYRSSIKDVIDLLQMRPDVPPRDTPRDKGIMSGYYNYDIDNIRDQHRQQQMSQYYNGGHRQEKPIDERVSSIKRLRKLLKI